MTSEFANLEGVMKTTEMRRRARGQVIAKFVASGMNYAHALREYDRLDQADFIRRYAHILNDDWLARHRF